MSRNRVEGLDLLRGFAILLVLIRHSWSDRAEGAGIVGVVVFFGLSGFLITSILLRDLRQPPHRVRYRRFYRNRFLRLVPALALMLAVFAFIELTFNILGQRSGVPRGVLVGMTYTMNLPGFGHGSDSLSHLWTLATEEQFYLVWPMILMLGVRFRRLGLFIATSAIGIYLLCAATIIVTSPDQVFKVYTLPTSWALVMVIGAAAANYQERIAAFLPSGGWKRSALSVTALGVLLAIAFSPVSKSSPATYLVLGPLIGLCTVALIFHLRTWQTIPTQWLRPLLELGTISYAAYLWNYPVMNWLGGPADMSPGRGLLTILVTIGAATVSWWSVERWTDHAKRWFDDRDKNGKLETSSPNSRTTERVIPTPSTRR